VAASSKLKETLIKLDQGKGTANMLLSDSASTDKLRQTIVNIEQGTSCFNEYMEALKHNFLFRKYFRKQKKALEQEQNAPKN
jgi:phospholipid/cholesterol/gamma-HCH transport system substrate-binding protein